MVLLCDACLKTHLHRILKRNDLFQVDVLRRGRGLGARVLRGGNAQKAGWPPTNAEDQLQTSSPSG